MKEQYLMKRFLFHFTVLVIITLLHVSTVFPQTDQNPGIEFPDIPGYQTLICDFHMHTVFSDGHVWPDIRVEEALKEGLDAIAITDHLEYQPHQEDIPHSDRNRPFNIAVAEREDKDLLIVNGTEITRDMPPGHLNAIFLKDVNALLFNDSLEVIREAKSQDAFVFWNHPNWIPEKNDGKAALTEMHRQLIRENLLDGIEVVNGNTFSEEALRIALEYNLAIIGGSDVHGLVDWKYQVPDGGHRPVTLVFAKEKSNDALKNALNAGKTAVWFKNMLIGKEENLVPLILQCLNVTDIESRRNSTVVKVTLENQSDAQFTLYNQSDYKFYSDTDLIMIEPHQKTTIQVKVMEKLPAFDLRFEVLNGLVAPETHPEINFRIQVVWEE